ncbi:MAG: tautomerase family protein [Pseudomonadota bacterium]
MPLYICNSKKDVLDADARSKIAQAITDIHCSVTGAPPCFVHAMFFEDVPAFPLEDNDL